MKRIILLIAFCLSLSAIYAQTINVIHLKNGFDARGTITNRTESQITLQSENGRILTIDMSEIESMEQEQKAFDPRVLIGRWACYKANGERDNRYDFIISENEGFYTISYDKYVTYENCGGSWANKTPSCNIQANIDYESDDGIVSFYFFKIIEDYEGPSGINSYCAFQEQLSCDIDLKYIDGKLKGSMDILNYYLAQGHPNYHSMREAIQDRRGKVLSEGPGGKRNVYYVKY